MKRRIVIMVAVVMGICMMTGCDAEEQAEQVEQTEQVEQAEPEEQDEPEDQAEPEEQDEPDEQPEAEQAKDTDVQENSAGSVLCFSGKDVNGNPVNTADVFAKNKITMVNMWASWCGPCAGEIPELNELNEEFREKGCEIVGFLIDGEDTDGLKDGKDILNDAGATYLNVICPDSIANAAGIEAIPTTFFVDSTGKILVDEPIVGAYPEEYPKTLDKLLSGM